MVAGSSIDVLFYILILSCGVSDLLRGKVYNHITYPLIAMGIGVNTLAHGLGGFKTSFLGILAGAIPLYIAFRFGGVGGGDVKFIAAIGALKGYPFSVYALFYSLLAGGAISLILLIHEGELMRGMRNALKTIFTAITPWRKTHPVDDSLQRTIPFGFAIALGGLWAQLESIMKASVIDLVRGLFTG